MHHGVADLPLGGRRRAGGRLRRGAGLTDSVHRRRTVQEVVVNEPDVREHRFENDGVILNNPQCLAMTLHEQAPLASMTAERRDMGQPLQLHQFKVQ
jgi:hypothetical protein